MFRLGGWGADGDGEERARVGEYLKIEYPCGGQHVTVVLEPSCAAPKSISKFHPVSRIAGFSIGSLHSP